VNARGPIWLIVLLVLASPGAMAFDQVLHSDVTYAVALANGFKPEEAALIANAAQSVDDNPSTAALNMGLLAKEAKEVASGNVKLSELPHMRSGQVFHALAGEEARQVAEQAHLQRIERVLTDPHEPGSLEQKERRRLVYIGEYLHFLSDTVVHPSDSLVGHASKGSDLDRGDRHEQSMRTAISLMNQQLERLHQGEALAPTPPMASVRTPGVLDRDPEKNRLLEDVSKAVVTSWSKTYANEVVPRDRIATAPYNPYDPWLEQRAKRAASEIGRVIQQHQLPTTYYRHATIELDSDGEPAGDQAREFGSARRLEVLPFAKTVADNPVLAGERARTVVKDVQQGLGPGAEAALRELGIEVPPEQLEQARREAAWQPPSGPGGVALDPGLVMPEGIGEPQRIVLEGEAIVLVTSTGRYPFRNLDPRSFATIARTVAAGEIPFVTIGTVPSGKENYARVVYSPSLIGTVEGEALYRADLTFKAMFARLPFGPEYAFNRSESELYRSYPGPGGEAQRMWITSGRVVLANQDGELVADRHGMRILSETILDGRPHDDPEMEAYAATLTANWDQYADGMWSLHAVEDMARATAIVFWARAEQVPIDPLIFTLPPRTGYTPAHAPLVAAFSEQGVLVAGGVALTPEDRRTGLGRVFLHWMQQRFLAARDRATHPTLMTAFLVLIYGTCTAVVIFVCSLFLWVICRWRISRRFPLRRAMKVWLLACLADFALLALAAPLVEGAALRAFDAELLAWLLTVIGFPWLLLWLLSREKGAPLPPEGAAGALRRAPGARALLVGLGQLGPMCNASLALFVAFTTAAITKPVPGPGLCALLTYELAPANGWSEGLCSSPRPDGRAGGVLWAGRQKDWSVPRSLAELDRPAFESPGPLSGPPPETLGPGAEQQDAMLPVADLRPVTWPRDMPPVVGTTHYAPEGTPPPELLWAAAREEEGKQEEPQGNRFAVARVLEGPAEGAREIPGGDLVVGSLWVESTPLLTERDIARASYDESSGEIRIEVREEAKEQLAEATRAAVDKQLAILLDGQLVAAPTIHEPIEDGTLVISGFADREADARRLVEALTGPQ